MTYEYGELSERKKTWLKVGANLGGGDQIYYHAL